jgi:tetratricopeptide (TPR) repeat protein
MTVTAEELINRSIDQRKRNSYEEALASALAAVEAAPDSANAWWQVSLNRWVLGDTRNALPALRKTVALAPRFDDGWALLGKVLLKTGDEKEATKAFEMAVRMDGDNIDALKALASIYGSKNDEGLVEAELAVLTQIEELAGLSSYQRCRLGIVHYRRRHFFEAIKYWQQDTATADDPASLFNLGLAYNNPEVSQDSDAVDMWRLTLRRFPDYEPPKKSLSMALPRLLQLARDARQAGETMLPAELWHAHYLNPFQLLDPPEGMDLEDFDAKTLQKLRKAMLQEIELEDGALPWMPGVVIDRSRAIAACEELNDEAKRSFHWHVFGNKPLMAFLGTGAHEHFLVDEKDSPLDTIERLDNEESGFRKWLSQPFADQYDRVLTKAIEGRNLVAIECLLDGRRWVLPSHADRCFENARRLVEQMLSPLLDAGVRAAAEKPSVAGLRSLLEKNSLIGVLNLLPTYFRDHQNAAAAVIRDVAVSCFNRHGDSDLSRDVLQLTKLFRFKSADLNRQLDEDFAKIDELIREERKHEARKSMGSEGWEITKDGVRKGDKFISVEEVTALRWGVMVSKESSGTWYDFLFAAAADHGRMLFTWKTKVDLEANQKHFGDLVNAALSYLFPAVAAKIESRLAAGQSVRIGPCTLSSSGIGFETKGWIFTDSHLVPWHRARATMENGDIIVSDVSNHKAKAALSARDVPNAVVLRLLVDLKSEQ